MHGSMPLSRWVRLDLVNGQRCVYLTQSAFVCLSRGPRSQKCRELIECDGSSMTSDRRVEDRGRQVE